MGVYAGDNAVNVAGEDFGDIGDWLTDAEADFLTAGVEAVTAEMVNADFEATPSAQGGFFEEQGNGAARKYV